MKNYIIQIGLVIFMLSSLPVTGEILFPTPDNLINAISNYHYPPEESAVKYLTIQGEDLSDCVKVPIAKYTNLEAVIVTFTMNPESPDSMKEQYLETIEKKLAHLSCYIKNQRLQYLILRTPEYLFIRSSDKLPYINRSLSIQKKADRLNLQRLNNRFGKKLEGILPGITIYAHNLSW